MYKNIGVNLYQNQNYITAIIFENDPITSKGFEILETGWGWFRDGLLWDGINTAIMTGVVQRVIIG